MKITDIKCTIFEWKPPTGDLRGIMKGVIGDKGAPVLMVSVLTDEGIEGYCNQYVGGSKGQADYIETRLRPVLVGEDPTHIESS